MNLKFEREGVIHECEHDDPKLLASIWVLCEEGQETFPSSSFRRVRATRPVTCIPCIAVRLDRDT